MHKVSYNFLPFHWGDVKKVSRSEERKKEFKPRENFRSSFMSNMSLMDIIQGNSNPDFVRGFQTEQSPNKFSSPLAPIKQISPRNQERFQSFDELRLCKTTARFEITILKRVISKSGIKEFPRLFSVKHLTGGVGIAEKYVEKSDAVESSPYIRDRSNKHPSSFVYPLDPSFFISRTKIGLKEIFGTAFYGSLFPKGIKLIQEHGEGKQAQIKERIIVAMIEKGRTEKEAMEIADLITPYREELYFPINSLLKGESIQLEKGITQRSLLEIVGL